MILNISQPFTLLLVLAATVLLLFLGREIKKSYIVAIPLGAFLILLILHAINLITTSSSDIIYVVSRCIALDFAFIFVTFLGYLWVDAIEAKEEKKKSIDNSLDWFWSKV
mgnify:FL=1